MWTLVWMLSLVAIATADFTFTCNPPASKTGPKIPDLPDQYEMRVETNVVQDQNSKTIEVLESYDLPGQRVALTMIQAGQVRKSIHNFKTQERYDIMTNDTCVTSNINSTAGDYNIFGFTVKGKDGKIHIASVSDVFRIGSKYNSTYVGEAKIRGIPVHHWTSCQVSDELHASFKLDYYFSRLSYVSADGSKEIPIRFTITGQAKSTGRSGYHNFNHVYEFSIFKPGPIKDPSVFETPMGVICTGRKNTVPFPNVADQMTYNMEADSVNSTRPYQQKVYFDYYLQTIRVDRFHDKEENNKDGAGLITRIEDFKTGLEYVIDWMEDNCTVHKMSNNMRFTAPSTGHNITMRHAYEFVKFKNMTYVYQGERRWRGLTVDAWANISDNIVHEYFFLKQPPVTSGPRPLSIPVGLYIKNITAMNLLKGQGQTEPGPTTPAQTTPAQNTPKSDSHSHGHTMPPEMFIQIFNYHAGHHDLELFDVSTCYKKTPNHTMSFTFSVSGSYSEDVYGHKSVFFPAVRSIMARSSNVSLTRVTNIQVRQAAEDQNKLIITFTLLDKAPMTGNVANPPIQTSLDKAKENLRKSASFGILFQVIYPTSPKHPKLFHVHVYSLQPTPTYKEVTATGPTYSAGSMAGLGIGMLIFGGIIGLLVAFVIHRRISTEVPYERN